MKPRRWFSGPLLQQWKLMTLTGSYSGPFFSFQGDPHPGACKGNVYYIDSDNSIKVKQSWINASYYPNGNDEFWETSHHKAPYEN